MRYITKDEEVKLIKWLEETEQNGIVWLNNILPSAIMIGVIKDDFYINGYDRDESGVFSMSLKYQLWPFFYKWYVSRGRGHKFYAIPLRSKLHKILNEKHNKLIERKNKSLTYNL